jgi:hypothetical protein
MSVPPESIEVGKCYLSKAGWVWRVVQILPDGSILYEQRTSHVRPRSWTAGA